MILHILGSSSIIIFSDHGTLNFLKVKCNPTNKKNRGLTAYFPVGNTENNTSPGQDSQTDWKTWKMGEHFSLRESRRILKIFEEVRELYTKNWKSPEISDCLCIFFCDLNFRIFLL